MDLNDLKKKPRADKTSAESGPQIHDRWALHAYAFEYETKPARLIRYHPGRKMNGELAEGYYDEHIPETYDSDRGQVMKKEVERKSNFCPDCQVAARVTNKGEPMCPECGLIVAETEEYNIVRDARAAGHIDGET